MIAVARRVVAIGASTGGPRALETVLTRLPEDLGAGVLVTQHMPSGFTRAFARRLNDLCRLTVREAEDGDPVVNGVVYVAPGDYHMLVDRSGRIRLDHSPPVEFVRPSADVMFHSVADVYGARAMGVILTGMGRDGAAGMAALRRQGAWTIAQDESTCAVFGMPKAAIDCGGADEVLPLDRIAGAIVARLHGPGRFMGGEGDSQSARP